MPVFSTGTLVAGSVSNKNLGRPNKFTEHKFQYNPDGNDGAADAVGVISGISGKIVEVQIVADAVGIPKTGFDAVIIGEHGGNLLGAAGVGVTSPGTMTIMPASLGFVYNYGDLALTGADTGSAAAIVGLVFYTEK